MLALSLGQGVGLGGGGAEPFTGWLLADAFDVLTASGMVPKHVGQTSLRMQQISDGTATVPTVFDPLTHL